MLNIPILKNPVKEHEKLKPIILKAIQDMGIHPIESAGEKISNTDWHLGSDFFRPYYNPVKPVLDEIASITTQEFNYKNPLFVKNYWFQQYQTNDWHGWHMHSNAMFSSVYYVELSEGSAKTSFNFNNTEFELDIEEGDVLTFPGLVEHCSKPNQFGQKTIISFNI
jgi:mannose-6-phosphate isomerase-like protein (cupin superfamily)